MKASQGTVNEKIDLILWTVTGKVSEVVFDPDKQNYNLSFRYDPMGNRIAKIEKPHATLANCTTWTITWYARDAQGNVLAVYNKPTDSLIFRATEFNIYGSSRIGMVTQPEALSETPTVPLAHSQTLGLKVYEFSNHLGNVLTTFSDRKIAIEGAPGYVAYYTAEILSSTDYYPFGFEMPGRSYTGGVYSYGFQGQEDDPEVHGSKSTSIYFKYRIHDTRIGRFLSVDPLAGSYPYNSSYAFSENKVIRFIELEGLEIADPQAFQAARDQINTLRNNLNPNGSTHTLARIDLEKILEHLEWQLENTGDGTDDRGINSSESNYCGSTWYCGKAAIQNVAMNYYPLEYVNFVYNLAVNGEARFLPSSPKTTLSPSIDPSSSVGPADQIFAMSLDHTTSRKSIFRVIIGPIIRLWNDKFGNDGTTVPMELKRLGRYVGLDIMYRTTMSGVGRTTYKEMDRVQWDVSEGYLPIYWTNSHKHFKTIHEFMIFPGTQNGHRNENVIMRDWDYGKINDEETESVKEFQNRVHGIWVPKRAE